MDLNEMNENWQKDAPTLAAMEKTNPFFVPEGYFEEMEEQLRSRIAISGFEEDEVIFKLPENYFDTLPDKINSIIRLEELHHESPQEIFSIPENYFDTLESKIKAKISAEEPKKTEVKVRTLFSSWTTYAAAACITAIISFGVYFNNTKSQDINAQIAELPADEIVDYLQLYSDAGDAPEIIKTIEDGSELSQLNPELSEQEIEMYLKSNL